jgi:hypothetical protein
MKPPAWTPPINGWQYPIELEEDLLGTLCPTAQGIPDALLFLRNGKWELAYSPRARTQPLNRIWNVEGTLEFCCAVLEAALKARVSAASAPDQPARRGSR